MASTLTIILFLEYRFYRGGTVAYNTKKSGNLLVSSDEDLHSRLLAASSPTSSVSNDILDDFNIPPDMSEGAKQYVLSKVKSTREAALSYCKHMGTDFVSKKAMFIRM